MYYGKWIFCAMEMWESQGGHIFLNFFFFKKNSYLSFPMHSSAMEIRLLAMFNAIKCTPWNYFRLFVLLLYFWSGNRASSTPRGWNNIREGHTYPQVLLRRSAIFIRDTRYTYEFVLYFVRRSSNTKYCWLDSFESAIEIRLCSMFVEWTKYINLFKLI